MASGMAASRKRGSAGADNLRNEVRRRRTCPEADTEQSTTTMEINIINEIAIRGVRNSSWQGVGTCPTVELFDKSCPGSLAELCMEKTGR